MPPEPKPRFDLPAVVPRAHTVVPAAQPVFMPEPEPFSALFSHYLWVIWQHAWQIALLVILCGAGALFFSKRITPLYESTATIDIDRRTPTGVVGQEATQSATGDSEQFIATQVRLIQSASVLRPVVDQFHLDDNRLSTNNSNSPQVKGAVSMPGLKVVHVPGTYIILITYRSTSPETAAAVANAVADSYIRHTFELKMASTAGSSRFMEKQIEELRTKMEKSTMAVTEYGRQMSFVNPEERTNVLTSRLLQLNTEYANAQSERVKKEAALNAVKNGSLESAQTSQQGENPRRLAEKLEDAQEKFEHVKAIYGTKHPEYEKAATEVALLRQALANSSTNTLKRVESEYEEAVNRETMLRKSVEDLKSQTDFLNSRSSQYQSRLREADADRKLYEELVQKIKEVGINAGFDNNAVRVADPAQPVFAAVSPNTRNNVLLAVLLSLFLGIAAAILRDATDTTVRDPEVISRLLRTEVIGFLPLVKDWKGRRHVRSRGDGGEGLYVPFIGSNPIVMDGFDEAMRSLRNTILISGSEQPSSLLFTSASPGEGKTTTAVHIAVAHALQGQRTLLIDADLRRPGTRQVLGYTMNGGLSEVIKDGIPWQDMIAKVEAVPDLDILPAGAPSLQTAALVEREMPRILMEARNAGYNLVVIDAPPMLGFSEPLQLSSLVDGVVIITRVGQTDRKAVEVVLSTLRRLRARVVGVVLNGVTKNISDRYTYLGGYEHYKSHYAEKIP
jgi:succinoglycan biosynthesis transport protein ExoP